MRPVLICFHFVLISLLCLPRFAAVECGSAAAVGPTLNVAIVGCGIGGAATQHFIHQHLSQYYDVHIDVYEANQLVGGRIGKLQLDAEHFIETGASIVHSSNAYMKSFTELLNLTRQQPRNADETMSIWDGHSFRLRTSNWSIVNHLKLLWRWGLGLFTLKREIDGVAQRFARFYDLQAHNRAFETVTEMMKAVNLYNLTQITLFDYLTEQVLPKPLSERGQLMLDELVAALTRVNYNQSPLKINALAGAVALIPTTGGDYNLWQVKEGNVEIVKGLMDKHAERTKVFLSSRVVRIEESEILSPLTKQQRYMIVTADSTQQEKRSSNQYDFVVVATPLDLSSIQLPFTPPTSTKQDKLTYTHTHTTFINGTAQTLYFNTQNNDTTMPGSILTTECDAEEKCRFSSLTAYLYDEYTQTTMYKIFSRQALNATVLNAMFMPGYRVLRSIDWQAYPAYQPPERLAAFRLAHNANILSVSVFEQAVSVTEGECVAANNVALLIRQQLTLLEREEKFKHEAKRKQQTTGPPKEDL